MSTITPFRETLTAHGLTIQDFATASGYSFAYVKKLWYGLRPTRPAAWQIVERMTEASSLVALPSRRLELAVLAYDPDAIVVVDEGGTDEDGVQTAWSLAVWTRGDILLLRCVADWQAYLRRQGQDARVDIEDAPKATRQYGPSSEWRYIPAVQG